MTCETNKCKCRERGGQVTILERLICLCYFLILWDQVHREVTVFPPCFILILSMDFLFFSFYHLSFYTYFMTSTSYKKQKFLAGMTLTCPWENICKSRHEGCKCTKQTTLMQKLLWKLHLSFTCSFQSTQRLYTSCGRVNRPHGSGLGCCPKKEDSLMALTGTEGCHHGTSADSVPVEFSHPKPCSN